jgi:hypothetical protein
MIIVRNPPAALGCLDLITATPELRAVEAAIRIARVSFLCAELTDESRWNDLRRYHGDATTFVLDLPVPVSMAVSSEVSSGVADDGAPMTARRW